MKRQYLKYACLTAGLLSAVVLPSSIRAEDPPAPPTAPSKDGKEGRPEMTPEQREQMHQKRMDEVAAKLGLDDSQKEQFKKIEEEQHEKMKALKDDTSLSQEDKKAKFMEIMKEGKEARDAVLTDDQKAKLAEMKKDHGPGGPGGPGGGFGHHGGQKDGGKGGSDKPAPAVPAPTAPAPTT